MKVINEVEVIINDRFVSYEDGTTKKTGTKSYKTSGVIPRIGDEIEWFYRPNPKVGQVVFDLENATVYINVE